MTDKRGYKKGIYTKPSISPPELIAKNPLEAVGILPSHILASAIGLPQDCFVDAWSQ